MLNASEGLTRAQGEVVAHASGPLLVLGGPGTGKTTVLLRRFLALVAAGEVPEAILVLALSRAAAVELRTALERALDRPYEALEVCTIVDFCAGLLHEEAREAGLDPFVVPATPADRLALLLERISELTLRRHDLGGNPAALLASLLERIDRLKEEGVDAASFAAWARALPGDDPSARSRAAKEREFAAVFETHDRMLMEAGMLDGGDLLQRTAQLLTDKPHVRARVAERHRHLLVDELQDLSYAEMRLVELLVAGHERICAVADEQQSLRRLRGAAEKNIADFRAAHPSLRVVRLEGSLRCPADILRSATAVVQAPAEKIEAPPPTEAPQVRFWRCQNDRAQAQAVAADIERMLAYGIAADAIGVLVCSVRDQAQEIAVALDERAIPYRVAGAAAFFQRTEIRDILAWLRLLCDPSDASAVVRALTRPPVELRAADLARCVQITRRRKLDMVSGLVAATESPQIPPEARERILTFLQLYRSAIASLDTLRPDLYVHRLIERLGVRRQQLFAAQADIVERLLNLARLAEMATAYVGRVPQATPREFARYIAAVADAGLRDEEAASERRPAAVSVLPMHAAKGLEFDRVYVLGLEAARMPGPHRSAIEPLPDALLRERLPSESRSLHVLRMRRLLYVAMTRARQGLALACSECGPDGAMRPASPFVEAAREAIGGHWETFEEELFGPAEALHARARSLRQDVLRDISTVAGRLGELRFDTDLDVSHAIVRYLELIKLAALIARAPEQPIEEALAEINARLARAVTAEQRDIFESSELDGQLLGRERIARHRAQALAAREQPTLEPFLPRQGDGLVLSASDIETYRICPLRYKFARVFRIPQEPTLNQRFGILVHQVLERFHAGGASTRAELLGLLDAGWRRAGLGDSDEELQLRAKATAALSRYHERLQSEPVETVWLERSFAFRLGPHLLRGRVDRVDRLPDGAYELVDYKTGRPRSAAELKHDIQLSLYAVGAREAWQLAASSQAYYYVLDDEKVPVQRDDADRGWITDTVLEVADGILSQGFEPTPSYRACSVCDYRIICPATER